MYFRQIHSTNERERFFETESKVSLLMTLDDLWPSVTFNSHYNWKLQKPYENITYHHLLYSAFYAKIVK